MTFAKGAPGCCCCKDIWHNGVGQYRLKGKGEDATLEIIAAEGNSGDYDPVNRVSFSISLLATEPIRIRRRYEKLEDDHSIIHTGPAGSESNGFLACDPATERIYYNRHFDGSTNNFIRRMDYDATNDGAIATVTGLFTTASSILLMTWHREENLLYYTLKALDGVNERIFICRMDPATGIEERLYDIARNSDANNIAEIELDYINEKLWWIEVLTTVGTIQYIKRSDYDGSNVETIHTFVAPLNACLALQVSYKDECLYTFDYNSTVAATADEDGGIFKRDFEYNEIEHLITRKKIREDTPLTLMPRFRLGCGFETVGPSNQG